MNAWYRFDSLKAPDGWLTPGWIAVADDGSIAEVRDRAPDGVSVETVAGPAIPGLSNLHSHAFQRAMAGLAEGPATSDDDFWSWRQALYRFVERLTPDDLEAIAAQLYGEMLRHGYTGVVEFHYLHHAADGRAYDDPAEMAHRLSLAARQTGIALTLAPTLYINNGFGGRPADTGQRRFVNSVEDHLKLVESAADGLDDSGNQTIALALHSLRAVPPDALAAAVSGFLADRPIHIHCAEQTKEVEECLAWSGARPVEWLLANAAVDSRWCLVHATHMTGDETIGLAQSGAVAGICPTTEADLGDGLFPLRPYLAAGGRLGVGTDSHVAVSAAEELRWLEYGQRLSDRKRNRAGDAGRSAARRLYDDATSGGAQAAGRQTGRLEAGGRADLVVLDQTNPGLAARTGDRLLDAYVFRGGDNPVRDVMVGGKWAVRDGRLPEQTAIADRFRRCLGRLLEGS